MPAPTAKKVAANQWEKGQTEFPLILIGSQYVHKTTALTASAAAITNVKIEAPLLA